MIQTNVSLRISGDFDPSEVTDVLDIVPSYTHRKGQGGNRKSIPPFYCDRWLLESPLSKEESLENHFLWLIEKIESKYDILREIKKYASIDIYVGIISIDMNSFLLSPKVLSIFHNLQIGLEVSLILFDDSEEMKEFNK